MNREYILNIDIYEINSRIKQNTVDFKHQLGMSIDHQSEKKKYVSKIDGSKIIITDKKNTIKYNINIHRKENYSIAKTNVRFGTIGLLILILFVVVYVLILLMTNNPNDKYLFGWILLFYLLMLLGNYVIYSRKIDLFFQTIFIDVIKKKTI